jgi:CheY-like chemotaxis protein
VANIEPSIAGKRCLVLDDEFLIALDIQQILESAGASVICVGNAADALEALRTQPKFDFAVLDVKLSGANGTSLTVAAILTEQGIPFVFLTGMRRQDVHAKEFPHALVVEKPYETPLLIDAVLRAFGSR